MANFQQEKGNFSQFTLFKYTQRPLTSSTDHLGLTLFHSEGIKQTKFQKLQPRPWFALTQLQQRLQACASCTRECVRVIFFFFPNVNAVWASYVSLTTANPTTSA